MSLFRKLFIWGQNSDETAYVTNNALDVNIQDQHSEIIDLHLTMIIQQVAIAVNTNIDDLVITLTTGAEPTDGNLICLKEGVAFYQGLILSHSANGGNWDVTLDTPLDFAFTTSGGCSENSEHLNVDGSAAPIIFSISPSNLTPGTKWDIVRVTFQIIDNTSMDDAKFGGLIALTKGIVVRVKNGITKNIFNSKTNADFALHAYDIAYSDKSPAGSYGFRSRRTFGGQSKNGVTIRLNADTKDEFQILIQDDLTGLTDFCAVAQGHIVE